MLDLIHTGPAVSRARHRETSAAFAIDMPASTLSP